MRRLIATTLVFFVLFANLAWAADLSEFRIATSADASLIVTHDHNATDKGASHNQKSDICDHCCHGSAHYVGFPSATVAPFVDRGCASLVMTLAVYGSRATKPPLQPPRI